MSETSVRSGATESAQTILVIIGFGYIIAASFLVLAVDAANLGGSRDWLEGLGLEAPMVWYHLFRERSPTEWFQWYSLGAASIIAAMIYGRVAGNELYSMGIAKFWIMMSIAFALMLIEDAGDPRFRISGYASVIFSNPSSGRIAEFSYFAALALVPLSALVLYGREIWAFSRSRNWLILGFVCYGVAGGGSATRFIGDWYSRLGSAITNRLEFIEYEVEHFDPLPFTFWIVDYWLEESIELAGALSFLLAALAFWAHVRVKPTLARETHSALSHGH